MKEPTKGMKIAAVIVLGFCAFFFLIVILSNGESSSVDVNKRIGSPLVYERIDSMTDCEELQMEFDRAYDNVEARKPGDRLREISAAYGEYAHQRMKKIGCYN